MSRDSLRWQWRRRKDIPRLDVVDVFLDNKGDTCSERPSRLGLPKGLADLH